MWQPNEIRVLRWFMRLSGVGLLIPGVIYLLSWPDTVKAFSACLGAGAAPILAGASSALSILGGLSFILARHARPGAIAATIALLLGIWVHYQWSQTMNTRLGMLHEGLSEIDRAMLEDTILFAANAQIPHILKNLVLVGVCAVVYLLAPKLCGNTVDQSST